MTRARTLADYVAGGSTAAEFDVLDGLTSTTAELNILDGVTSTAAELNILDGVTSTAAELNHVDGVTSNVQTQMNAKAPLASPAFTGTPTGITAAHLEAGVLPSDVTGGSGLTALGTVTSGNLSNTALVYPAGHVIQTISKRDVSGSYSNTSPSNDTWYVTNITCTITPKLTSSYISLVGHVMVVWSNSSGDGGHNIRWKRTQSGQSDAHPDELNAHDGSGSFHASSYSTVNLGNPRSEQVPFAGLDKTVHVAGVAITYTLEIGQYNCNTIAAGATYNGGCYSILQEIVL